MRARRGSVVLVVALLAACGGDDDGGEQISAVDLLSAAPDAARESGSARMTMAMSLGGEGMSMDIDGEGVVDFESGAGEFEMSMFGMDLEMVTDGETLWMRIPTGEVDGTSWIEAPADLMQGQQMGSMESATGFLDALRGISAEVAEEGTEEVNGYDATHYSAIVDIEDAIAAAPEANRAEAEAALERLGEMGSGTFPIDVWVTEDGLPTRMVMSFAPPADAEGGDDELSSMLGDFELRMQLDMTDFGTEVDIEPPDPSEVRVIEDESELAEIFGGGSITEELSETSEG